MKIAICIMLALAAAGCGGEPPTPTSPPAAVPSCTRGRAFVLVRHAEKASAEKDPPLSDRGRARAETLASMLAHAGVTRLVATQYKRTQETLAPLATRLGLPVDVRPADRTQDLVGELRAASDGAVVVVASHSNVLPLLARELGKTELRGVSDDALPEDDFGRVILVTEACGAARPFVVELCSER